MSISLRKLEIETPERPEQVVERLRVIIAERMGWLERLQYAVTISKPAKPFQGALSAESFRISRVIGYGNAFLPVVRGQIAPVIGGTRVRVTMALPLFSFLFMSVWVGGLLACLALTVADIALAKAGTAFFIMALLLAGLGMVALAFYPEARKAERLLREALKPTA